MAVSGCVYAMHLAYITYTSWGTSAGYRWASQGWEVAFKMDLDLVLRNKIS